MAIELKTASFKGVELLFISAPTTGGNRLIKYLYPRSDKQSIERQGKFPRSHSMTVVIPHKDYYATRDNTIRVLEEDTKGTLVHPTFGTVDNIFSGQYSLEEKITELGRATITVNFELDDASGVPVKSGNLPAQVQSKSLALNATLGSSLAENYKVDNNLSGNFADAIENIGNISSAFNFATSTTKAIDAQSNIFRGLTNAFANNVGNLVTQPIQLAESINTLFDSVQNLYETPEQTFSVLSELFKFGDNDPVVFPTTVARTERIKNRSLISGNMKTQALSNAYTVASTIDYTTQEELQGAVTALETQYVDIRENELISNESLLQLDSLRVQSAKTFDDIALNTQQIITVNIKKQPLPVYVFSQYGNLDNLSKISTLNNIEQQGFVEGDLRILTA